MRLTPPERARTIIEGFGRARVLIVGDVMIDHFLTGRVTRLSPEAPVPVVQYQTDDYRLGGAANVASNVMALGGMARLVGVVGRDDAAERLRDGLGRIGADANGLVVDTERPTTRKLRIITERRQQVARVDYESDDEVSGEAAGELIATLTARLPETQVVIVSDYLKGVVTAALMATLVERARALRVVVLVDPKVPHLDYYRGVHLITPNHHEAEAALHLRIRNADEARQAARAFRARAACDSVLITRGEHGMWLLDGPAFDASAVGGADDWGVEAALPSMAREVADVTGAGDTVVATMALALASGATLLEAADLANHAAGLVVAKFGPATVNVAELAHAAGVEA